MRSIRSLLIIVWPVFRRIAVFVVGMSVLVAGMALLVLPGPAFVVIPMGLGILAIEFPWARHWLAIVKERAIAAAEKVRARARACRTGPPQPPPPKLIIETPKPRS